MIWTKNLIGGVIVFTDVCDSIALATELMHIAIHGHLTGLPNRLLLNDRLAQAISNALSGDKILTVLSIDIDNSKFLNDSLSHRISDTIIQLIVSFVLFRLTF